MFGPKHKSSPLSRLNIWKLLDRFNVIYSGALFFKKTYYKYFENSHILNGKNNLDIFEAVCISTPEFLNIAFIQFSRKKSIIDTKGIEEVDGVISSILNFSQHDSY